MDIDKLQKGNFIQNCIKECKVFLDSISDPKNSCCYHIKLYDHHGNSNNSIIKLYNNSVSMNKSLGSTASEDKIRRLFKDFCFESRIIIKNRIKELEEEFNKL